MTHLVRQNTPRRSDGLERCEIAPPDESPMAGMVNADMARQGREEVTANLMRLKSILEGRSA